MSFLLLCRLAFLVFVAARRCQAPPCETSRCLSVGKNIYEMLDRNSDPCESPHLFYCGTWMKTFRLADDEGSWTASFSEVKNKTREHLRVILEDGKCSRRVFNSDTIEGRGQDSYDDMLSCYYQSCMDTTSIERAGAEPLIRQMKLDAPFLYALALNFESMDAEEQQLNPDERKHLLSQRAAQLWISMGIPSWLKLSVDPSVLSHSGSYVLYLNEGGLSLQYRQYEQPDFVQAYLEYSTSLLAAFILDVQAVEPTSAAVDRIHRQAAERAKAVLDLERDIKSISFTPEQKRNPKLTINKMSIEELRNRLHNALDIDVFLSPFFEFASPDAKEEDKQQFIVEHPAFISELAAFIESKWSWATMFDAMLIRTIRHYVNVLPRRYRDALDQFQGRLLGVAKPPRWRRCQAMATNHLGWILALRYVKSMELPERRKEISVMLIQSLKESYAEVISSTSWMDDTTKESALKKLNAMTHKLGYPDWLLSDSETYFKNYFGDPDVQPMLDLVSASKHMSNQRIRFHMSRLSHPKDSTEWEMVPQEVNAYFDPIHNEIVFPLAIMQDPFLRVWTECSRDENHRADQGSNRCSNDEEAAFMKILTFGGLGSVVGHELTHGFDDSGRQFDAEGQFIDWWTTSSTNAFKAAAQCLSDQYSRYALRLHRPDRQDNRTESVQEIPLSGMLTLGENIADSGGIKLAYRALRRLHPEYFVTPIVGKPLSDAGFDSSRLFISSFAQIWCDVAREKSLMQRITGDPHSPNPFRILGTLSNFYGQIDQCPNQMDLNLTTRIETDLVAALDVHMTAEVSSSDDDGPRAYRRLFYRRVYPRSMLAVTEIEEAADPASLSRRMDVAEEFVKPPDAMDGRVFDAFHGVVIRRDGNRRCGVW